MSATLPDLNEQTLYTALRLFIISIVPEVDVIQGLQNQMAMPATGFIAMTTLFMQRLSSNHFDYDSGQKSLVQPQQYTVQIDCYGEQSNEWAILLSTVLRDAYACDHFPENIKPLYVDDPKHLPITNSEQQYEKRWMISAAFQVNPKMDISL